MNKKENNWVRRFNSSCRCKLKVLSHHEWNSEYGFWSIGTSKQCECFQVFFKLGNSDLRLWLEQSCLVAWSVNAINLHNSRSCLSMTSRVPPSTLINSLRDVLMSVCLQIPTQLLHLIVFKYHEEVEVEVKLVIFYRPKPYQSETNLLGFQLSMFMTNRSPTSSRISIRRFTKNNIAKLLFQHKDKNFISSWFSHFEAVKMISRSKFVFLEHLKVNSLEDNL